MSFRTSTRLSMAVAVMLAAATILAAYAFDRTLRQKPLLGNYPWIGLAVAVVIALALLRLQNLRAEKGSDSLRDALFWPFLFCVAGLVSELIVGPADGSPLNPRGALVQLAGLVGASLIIYAARQRSLS